MLTGASGPAQQETVYRGIVRRLEADERVAAEFDDSSSDGAPFAADACGAPPPLAVLADPRATERIVQPLDGVDIILATSGSTDGAGHLVGLSLAALAASARATHTALAGPGQWATALTPDHVAGFQVLFRAALAGTTPLAIARWDNPDHWRSAVAQRDPGVPLYTSLVPTQLLRLLELAPDALASFDAVLVGGAALSPALAVRARQEGVRVVRTYGMTETSGGCVYDGRPLPGAAVRIVPAGTEATAGAHESGEIAPSAGLVQIAGTMLATRYLDTAVSPFLEDDGERWFATSDMGTWDETGRLRVLGRADDVIVSGGVNVSPRVIEEAIEAALGGLWVVIGLPDATWGQRVVAVSEEPSTATLDDVRRATRHLAAAERPKDVVGHPIPRTRLGKIDRRALTRELAGLSAPPGRGC